MVLDRPEKTMNKFHIPKSMDLVFFWAELLNRNFLRPKDGEEYLHAMDISWVRK